MSTRTLLTALFATALTMPALAQPAATPSAQAPAVTPAAAPVATVEGAAPTTPSVSRDKDTLSVDFPDEEIKTILRNVADLFELNLVVPDTLTGKTSIKLRDVTWRQIFQVVLAPAGYTYIEDGNIIKVVSNELLQQEPVATEVFVLNNAKAADIKPTIDGLVDAATGGKIVVDARSNALVITERPSHMSRIRNIIDKLDKATDQVMIESKFVEVTDSDIRNIGVNWTSLQGMTLGINNISKTYSKGSNVQSSDGTNSNSGTNNGTSNSNSTTTGTNGSTNNSVSNGTTTNTSAGNNVTYVTTPNSGFAGIPSTVSFPSGAVSGLPASVPSTTTLANITAGPPPTATALNTFQGTSTTGTNGSTNVSTNDGTSTSTNALNSVTSSVNNAFNTLASLTNTGTTSRLASAVFSSSDFNVIISALKQNSNTKIVSNPTIVTLNNTEAFLNIGQEFPIPSYTYNSERGSFEVSGFTYKPIGIILKVTPQVNAQGIIKLALEPEVSQQNGTTSFGGAGGANIPVIATRKVKTQISLKDGYTAGIGGLITASKQHGGSSVPILGDIPLLGRLFSSKNVNDVTTNLLIFITAKTVNADGASAEEMFDPRAIEAVGMSREDLPGHRAPKGTDMFPPAPSGK